MANILILFSSKTGNTETMAEYVQIGIEKIPGHLVRILRCSDASAEDLKWCDGIAVGTPTNSGLLSWELKKWFDDLPPGTWGFVDGKLGCAFSSAGSMGGGGEIACMSVLQLLINFGFLVFGVTDYVNSNYSAHYGALSVDARGSECAKASCIRIGQRLAEWLSFYIGKEQEQHPVNKNEKRFHWQFEV
jgi:NAD(P)H dehydrogenase (quinone)